MIPTRYRPTLHRCCVTVHTEVRDKEARRRKAKTQNRELNLSPANRFNRSSPCCLSDCWRSQQDKVGPVQQEASLRWKASERPMHNEWMANRQNARVDKSSLKHAEQFGVCMEELRENHRLHCLFVIDPCFTPEASAEHQQSVRVVAVKRGRWSQWAGAQQALSSRVSAASQKQ